MTEKLECLNAGDGKCKGPVEQHSYSGRLKCFPRCEFHHRKRVEIEQGINERYPYHQPADFDPSDAGERWDDDY